MQAGKTRKASQLVAGLALISTALMWSSGEVSAASFTNPPTRLYMAPIGTTLPPLLPVVPIGTLTFNGSSEDLISNDIRNIEVESTDVACDHSGRPAASLVLTGCTTVQLTVGNGYIKIPNSADGDVRVASTGGAILHTFGTARDVGDEFGYVRIVYISGLVAEVNAGLDTLTYQPEDGYYYAGNDPEEIRLHLTPGDSSLGSLDHEVQIRVLDVNDWPELTVPSASPYLVATGGSRLLQDTDPDPAVDTSYVVTDIDNDESTDTAPDPPCPPGDPGGTGGPCQNDPNDGAGDDALLLMFTTCGGFEFLSTLGFAIKDDIQELLTDAFAADPLNPTANETLLINAIVTGLESAAPEVATFQLATVATNGPVSAFAGIARLQDINYTLDNVTLWAVDPATNLPINNMTCDVFTVVTDLGNNGLPVKYLGDPPIGIELPWLGVDFDWITMQVGDGTTIDASLPSGPLQVPEGDLINVPIAVTTDHPTEPLSHPAFDLTVTATGTATTAVDYTAVTTTVTVLEDETSVNIPISTIEDLGVDPGETIMLTISGPTTPPPGYQVSTASPSVTVTIIDDDIEVSIAPTASINEGSSGGLAVTVNPPDHPAFSMAVSTTNGSAVAPDDYTALGSQPVSVPLDDQPADVLLTTIDDAIVQGPLTFSATLSGPSLQPAGFTVRITNASSTVTIVDDEVLSVSIDDVTIAEGDAGTSNAVFTVRLSDEALGGESVDIATADGSATTADNDYTAVTTSRTFALGETEKTVLVPVVGDTANETNQTFVINLSNASGLSITDSQGIGTITNDDLPSVISIADGTITEGASATTAISMTNFAGRTCTVTVTSSNGTAVAPGDYSAYQGGNFNIINMASDVLSLSAVNDDFVEPDETYTLTLALASGSDPRCELSDATATVTIVSEDVASVISIADGTITEGASATTAISMTNFAGRTCTVTVTSSNGTAVAPGDYSAYQGGNFNIINMASDVLSLSAVDDSDDEPAETYTLTLALASGTDPRCQLGDASATILIADNDGPADITPPFVTVEQASGQDDPTSVSPVLFEAVFIEPVVGFDATDVVFTGSTTNGTLTATVTGGPAIYTISVGVVGATNTGTVEVSIPAGAATDGTFLSPVSTSTDNEVTFDPQAPTVTINHPGSQADPTGVSPIVFDVVFSEAVTGFVTGDVTLSGTAGGVLTGVVAGIGTTYTVSVSGMTSGGTVIADIAAGVATDSANNPNLVSTSIDKTVTFTVAPADNTDPTVTINKASGQDDPTTASPILFTVVFSEPVIGFAPGSVTLSGTAGATSVAVSGTGPTYTLSVTGMTQSGTVIASISSDEVQDAAGNINEASTSTDNTVQFNVAPGPLTLNLPANIVTNNDPGLAGATVSYPTVTASGGTPPTTVVCTPASATFYPLGLTVVSCTATDSAAAPPQEQGFVESITTGTFTIQVNDAEPPVIADLPDLGRSTTNVTPVAVTFVNPAATDNSGVAPTVVCTPASGSSFQVGVATVTCTATDGAGNQASSSFTVTVNSNPSGGVIPVTGSAPFGLLLAALAMTAAGLFLLFGRSRRRAPHTTASRR